MRTRAQDEACSTTALRSLNAFLATVTLVALQAIIAACRAQQSAPSATQPPGAPSQGKRGPSAPSRSHSRVAQGGLAATAPAWLQAITLSAYPLHWFNAFLYYTDVASLLFLLLCQLSV